jgi:hypothetical protein
VARTIAFDREGVAGAWFDPDAGGGAFDTEILDAPSGGGGSPITVTPGVGALTLSGFRTRRVVIGTTVTPGVGQLTLTGFAPAALTRYSPGARGRRAQPDGLCTYRNGE